MNEKYYSLQILRAIAAWMVFYHHYMQIFHDFEYESLAGHLFVTYGRFGVDIFFVLSGFVMYFSAKSSNINGTDFFIKRFFRVVPAYWFYTLLLVLFVAVFPTGFSYTSYNLTTLLASLSFIPIENPSGLGMFPFLTVGWTLNFEMMFYTILSLSLILSKNKALLLCAIIILVSPYLYPDNLLFFQVLGSVKLLEFLAGFCVAFVVTSSYFKPLLKYRLILMLLSLITGLLCLKLYNHYWFWYLEIMAAGSFVFSAVLSNYYLRANHKFVNYLVKMGDFSYSTYLAHVFVLGISFHFLGNKLNPTNEIVALFGMSICLYLVSKYSYLYIEKNKKIELIKHSTLRLTNKSNPLGP